MNMNNSIFGIGLSLLPNKQTNLQNSGNMNMNNKISRQTKAIINWKEDSVLGV